MSQPILASFAAAVFALGAQTAFAQNKAGEDVPHPGTENFHAQCIGCHGIPGYKTAFPNVYHVPMIAGQQPGYIVAALSRASVRTPRCAASRRAWTRSR